MNETQQRIKAYQEALPGLKERVAAVALLLVLSMVMLTSASFAWLTISRAPEVSGVNTTVAANGNLEIALASGDGTTAPGESKVGDSSAAKGQSITKSNLTWGNLVNLGDPSYGLENLTMRPAQLNRVALLDSPLYGAVFSKDGRVSQLNSNFAYTTWVGPSGDKPGYFGVSDEVGVRAISATKIEAVGAEAVYVKLLGTADEKNRSAGNIYTSMADNKTFMQSLATMMGLYMTDRMDNDGTYKNPEVKIEDIGNMILMYEQFLKAFDAEAEAMAALADVQLFLMHGEGKYEPYTKEKIYAAGTSASLKNAGITISDLEGFIKDRNDIAASLEDLKALYTSGAEKIYWAEGMADIVNTLVNVGECTMGDGTKIKNIGATAAMNYINGTQEAIITNGILYNFELRTGAYIEAKELSITVSVKRSFINRTESVKANVHTSAIDAGYTLFNNDLKATKEMNDGNYVGGVPVAEDTYGLAVDLWVRTNAQASYLTLEGNVITETTSEEAFGTDPNGNEVALYTVTVTSTDDEGNAFSYSYDVYKGTTITTDENGNQTEVEAWIRADTHSVVTEEDLSGVEPIRKMNEIVTVLGYEGENRVWQDNSLLTADATTQGSGSCYVYYADTPEDQARSLQLLEAFNVAFVDEKGKLMATAIMDTERFYADNGRVIVPLVLNPSNSIDLGEDIHGNPIYAITGLEQNVPTRITAIVYLDGTKLTNDKVLAAADIQGQLNIQFGSNQNLAPIENEELEKAYRSVSASVDKTSFDYDTATEPMATRVSLIVDSSEQPNTVEAFFLRAINSTQGSREKTMTFDYDEASGKWIADYTFTAPGNYVLRTVSLDGQEYVLSDDTLPTVTVTGFTVENLTCSEADDNRYINIMTASNSHPVNLELQFATDDESKMPRSVQGRFINDETGAAVNVNFTYNSTQKKWTGSASFLNSGNYTMQFLVLNGDYVELKEDKWLTAKVTLGMRVAIYTNSPHSFKYVPSEMADNEKLLSMQVKIMDNAGNEMLGLSGVKLSYGMKGSGVKKMDTDLTWNGTYYVGELTTTGPGIWQFKTVTVGSNTITSATTSPTFTIMSPEPPEYYQHATTGYQYKPNNDATMNVQITNSSAAAVQAYIIKSGAAEGAWVTGVLGDEGALADGTPYNNWSFKVPMDANGYQDGNWQLTKLELWDVYAADGTAYTEESPLEIDVSDTNNMTKVVNRVYVTFAEDQSKDFGKDADGNVTAGFMTSHTISGLNVEIKDFENKPVDGVSDVQLTFTYQNGTSSTYGGYSSDSLNNATEGATITVKLDSVSGINYAQRTNASILYAGKYITAFTFKINGATASGDTKGVMLRSEIPAFTVWSAAPSVKITAITPTGSNPAKITYTTKSLSLGRGTEPTFTATGNQTSAFDTNANTATLYAVATADNDTQRHGGFTQPTLTVTVAGVDSGSTVSFTLPGGSANDIVFSRTGNGTIKNTLGKVTQIKSWKTNWGLYTHTLSAYYGHGDQTIKTVTVTKDGATYTITLDKPIVIKNPNSVNQ